MTNTIFSERYGYNFKTVHFWPLVGKAKMRLETIQFFIKQTAENSKQIRIKKIV